MADKWDNMGTRKGQEGAREAQVGPKMVQVGSRWGRKEARWAPRRARKAQERPKLVPRAARKPRDPKNHDFWATFGACFRRFFVPQAVF